MLNYTSFITHTGWSQAQEGVGTVEEVTVDADLGSSREGSRTGQ